jgi:hypothetical protein
MEVQCVFRRNWISKYYLNEHESSELIVLQGESLLQGHIINAPRHENVWGSGGIAPPFLTSALDGGEYFYRGHTVILTQYISNKQVELNSGNSMQIIHSQTRKNRYTFINLTPFSYHEIQLG